MIHVYTQINPVNQKNTQACQQSWVYSTATDEQEVAKLVKEYDVPESFFHDALDINERPRVEKNGNNTLLMIHVPYTNPNVENHYDDVKYRTLPLGIILSPKAMILVSTEELLFDQNYLLRQEFAWGEDVQGHNALVMVNDITESFIEMMHKIEFSIAEAEDELSHSYRNQELYSLLYLNESLLFMATSLKQMLHMMRKETFCTELDIREGDNILLSQTLVELEQVYAVAQINQQNLNNVMDAYGNIIQNNVSHVVKLLTAITIVLSIPTLIASIYGMNVPLPFQEMDGAFSYLIVAMAVSCSIVGFIFYKKRYF